MLRTALRQAHSDTEEKKRYAHARLTVCENACLMFRGTPRHHVDGHAGTAREQTSEELAEDHLSNHRHNAGAHNTAVCLGFVQCLV